MFTQAGLVVAMQAKDGFCGLWLLESDGNAVQLAGFTSEQCRRLERSVDGAMFAVVGKNIEVWSASQGERPRVRRFIECHMEAHQEVAVGFARTGAAIWAHGPEPGSVTRHDVANATSRTAFEIDSSLVVGPLRIRESPSGKYLAIHGKKGTALVELGTLQPVRSYWLPETVTRNQPGCFSHDDRHFIVGGSRVKTIDLYDPETFVPVVSGAEGSARPIAAVSWDGRRMIFGLEDGSLQAVDTMTV